MCPANSKTKSRCTISVYVGKSVPLTPAVATNLIWTLRVNKPGQSCQKCRGGVEQEIFRKFAASKDSLKKKDPGVRKKTGGGVAPWLVRMFAVNV